MNRVFSIYRKEQDLVVLLYVDDVLADGNEDDIKWIFDRLDEVFVGVQGGRMDIRRLHARLPRHGFIHG